MSKKNTTFQVLLAMIPFAALCFAQPVFAGLYKWTDDTGKTHYTDDKGKIPKKYRTNTRLKKMRALDDRSFNPAASSSSSKGGGSGAGTGKGSGAGEVKDKGILSEKEEKTVVETVAFFESENARSAKYKGLPNYSPNYRTLQLEIQKDLPQKKKLIAALANSKNPALKETYEFLKKSETGDHARLKAVWQDGYTGGYFRRILSEIEPKKALIGKLQAAIEESKKKKEEKLKEEEEKEKLAKENEKKPQAKK